MLIDLRKHLCSEPLKQLGQETAQNAAINFAIGGLPLITFAIMSVNSRESSFLDREMLECSTATTTAGAMMCFLRNTVWWFAVPFLKILAFPFEVSIEFFQEEPIFGVSRATYLVIMLILGVTATVCLIQYIMYRFENLHFRYKVNTHAEKEREQTKESNACDADKYESTSRMWTYIEKIFGSIFGAIISVVSSEAVANREGFDESCERKIGPCIDDRVQPSDEAEGIDCNPGLASTKANHLRASMSLMKKYISKQPCKSDSSESAVNLEALKLHMTVAAKRVIEKSEVWVFVYESMGLAIAVSAAVATMQALYIMQVQARDRLGHLGTRSITVAFVSFTLCMLVLAATSINVVLNNGKKKHQTVRQRFLQIDSALMSCKDSDETCRKTLGEKLGDAELVMAHELSADSLVPTSPRLLAAAVAIACIVAIMTVAYRMGIFSTSRGLRYIQSQSMRKFASGRDVLKTAAKGFAKTMGNQPKLGGGGVMSPEMFSNRLYAIQRMIGDSVPVAHVVGWALGLTSLSTLITVQSWVELVKTLDAM